MIYRILPALVGGLMGLQALGWITNPATAAAGLGMPLLEGMARSTQIGDFSAFFVCVSGFALFGAWQRQGHWLISAGLILGAAAVFRTFAWLVHDAPLASVFIGTEITCAAILILCAGRIHPAEA
ncbi:MAG: hypothetical protein CBC94_004320 [Gammaproteobacteria bacterium TMED134]|nr:MAG: hypothetical protein CBC94_004320 [Gammaproteobacteria bacterium TMED134]